MASSLLRLLCVSLLALTSTVAVWSQCTTGQFSTNAPLRFNTLFVCSADGQADEIEFRFDYNVAANSAVLLVDQNFNLIEASASRIVDLEGFPIGRGYAIGLTYSGDLLVQPGDNIFSVALASGCAQRSQNNIAIQSEGPQAGQIRLASGGTKTLLCLEDSTPDFEGFENVNAQDFNGYVYLVTDPTGRVEAITGQAFYNFQYLGAGVSRVYGLAFNRNLRVRPGDMIGTATLAEGCYSLTSNFLTIEREVVDGGRILVDGSERVTIDSNRSPILDVVRTSSSDADVAYVIINRQSEVLALSPGPLIDFTCIEPGDYLVYAYSYTGNVQIRVGDLLWQSGNRFASGCFLISDNAIVVKKTSIPSCQPSCLADAGTLTVAQDTLDLVNGVATLAASPAGNAVVPADYETLFVLSQGIDATIVALSFDQPRFAVTTSGDYSIHTLVAEVDDSSSSDFIDLSTIEVGTTTIATVDSLIDAQGLCADLANPGAAYFITVPAQGPCTAFAGAATPVVPQVTLVNGEAIVEANPDGSASVPSNFELKYLLTQGFLYTIVAIGDQPSFTVTEAGDYTIHPLVVESTDHNAPDFVDLGDIELGVTSALDFVLDAFDAGKCIDLDFFGAPISVIGGQTCTAEAGTTTAAQDTVGIQQGGTVRIESSSDGNSTIPTNFDRTYLLADASGIVLAFSARSRFTIQEQGNYFIHEWIGEFDDASSSSYVDLNALAIGAVRVTDLVDFIDGAGLCGDLDASGTQIVVQRIIQPRPGGLVVRTNGPTAYLTFATHSKLNEGLLQVLDLNGRVLSSQSVDLRTGQLEVATSSYRSGGVLVFALRDAVGVRSAKLMLPNF